MSVEVPTLMQYEYLNSRYEFLGFLTQNPAFHIRIVVYHCVTFLVIQSPFSIVFRRFKHTPRWDEDYHQVLYNTGVG